jgi:hypothetical protein
VREPAFIAAFGTAQQLAPWLDRVRNPRTISVLQLLYVSLGE